MILRGVLNKFHRGVLTLSLDFELVWGSRDLYADPAALLQAARVTRDEVFEPLLALFTEREMVATWATVGHLFLDRAARVEGRLHPDVVPPRHAWVEGDWFDGVPEGDEASAPEFYGRSLVERLRDAGQEVGSHGFSHPVFGDPGCSDEAARTDLQACVRAAEAVGIRLESFVFPRNSVGHRGRLAESGFVCWRGLEPVWYLDERAPRILGRLGHLADVVLARRPPTVMPFRDEHGLWCVPGTASFLPIDGVRRAIPISRRVKRATRGIDRAAQDQRVCHLWFHPINFASGPRATLDMLRRVLDHAARLRDSGRLDVLPMAAVARQAEAMSGARA